MDYIGWPTQVNRRIIDQTNVTVGDGATITDAIEGSPKQKRRVVCANPADKFSVVMHFNCYDRYTHDDNGNEVDPADPLYNTTEKDRFFNWFKAKHKFGTVPFEFPSILWNSNMKESFDEDEVARGHVPFNEHYIITSAVEGAKHGFDIEVKMTWETFATGIYEVPYDGPSVLEVEFHNGYAAVLLENECTTTPVSTDFRLYIDDNPVPLSLYNADKDSVTFYITYNKFASGEHNARLVFKEGTSEQKTFTGNFNGA